MTCRFHSLLCLAALSALAGCARETDASSGDRPSASRTGDVRLGLAIATNIDVDEVRYTIEIPGFTAIEGKLPVQDGETMLGTVTGVPAAAEVKVSLDAESASGEEATCHGEGTVAVQAAQTTSVFIVMQCRLSDGSAVMTGAIDISGRINVCPQLTTASATAGEAGFATSAEANDLDGDALGYTWSATSGSFEDANAAATTYTCDGAGMQLLTVTVDDEQGCTHAEEIKVLCEGEPADAGSALDAGGEDAGAPELDGGADAGRDSGSSPAPDSGTPDDEDGGPSAPPPSGTDAGGSSNADRCAAPADACEECGCTECASEIMACNTMEGSAAEGPGTGRAKAELCDAVVRCGQEAGCRGTDCFCGAGTDLVACLLGMATGPCQEEIKAAAETDDPATVSSRQSDPAFAVGRANAVSACTVNACSSACGTASADAGT